MYLFNVKHAQKKLFYGLSALLLSFIALLLISVVVDAKPMPITSVISVVDISDEWKFHLGDDKEWANPEFDDSSWPETNIVQSWKDTSLSNFSWYRKEIILSQFIDNLEVTSYLGIQIGQLEYGFYEVYVNGEKSGNFGSFPPNNESPLAIPMVFHLPKKAVESNRLILSVKVWKDSRYINRANFYNTKHEGYQDKFAIGMFDSLKDKLTLIRQNKQKDDITKLFMAVFCILVGLYHFQLYFGRKQLKEYFWFGLFSVGFAVNVFFNSAWGLEVVSTFTALFLRVFSRQILIIPCLQFLSIFLSLPTKKWMRLIQEVQAIVILVIFIWPDAILTTFNAVTFTFVIMSAFIMLAITIKKAYYGDPEANVMVFGLLILTGVEFLEAARILGVVKISFVAHWGFAGLILSIAVALSKRFNRVYAELDGLNHELENKVVSRTAELAETNEQLAGTNNQLAKTVSQLQEAKAETEHKNKELDKKIIELNEKNQQLIISQQQADRIFSALAEALPGTVLDGKYRLEEKIGSGGYGAVFKARHLELDTSIAIKVFRPTQGNDSPEAIERFRLEGISACRVSHPNAINVLDSSVSSEGIAYIVMELLVGHTLKDEMLNEGTLSLKRCAEIIIPVCQALVEAHKAGIVHRDIKPDNIFLHQSNQGEVVKVVDFGIAKLIEGQNDSKQRDLTESGSIVGTPVFISPERLRGQAYDGRADVYSLGITLYEMLSGERPFYVTSNNPIEIVLKCIKEPPTPLRDYIPNIPKSIETLVMNTLGKNPSNRPTALEFAKAFDQEITKLQETDPEALLVKADYYEEQSSDRAIEINEHQTVTNVTAK